MTREQAQELATITLDGAGPYWDDQVDAVARELLDAQADALDQVSWYGDIGREAIRLRADAEALRKKETHV